MCPVIMRHSVLKILQESVKYFKHPSVMNISKEKMLSKKKINKWMQQRSSRQQTADATYRQRQKSCETLDVADATRRTPKWYKQNELWMKLKKRLNKGREICKGNKQNKLQIKTVKDV